MYLVYIATSPSNKKYIGVTNNLKRRLKEHLSSPYPFGRALRKYGKDNFTYETIEAKDVHDALEMENLLVTEDEVNDDQFYNLCVGGTLSQVLQSNNPMHDPDIVAKHPSLFSTTKNPMFNPKSKQKMIEAQKKKKVLIGDVLYDGVRYAANQIGISRQCLIHRIKSDNFPNYQYWD